MVHCSSCLQERDLLTLPLKGFANPRHPAALARLQVLKRISFEPALMRSGVVAADHKAPAGSALLFVKGAPSRIRPLLRQCTLPPDFQQVSLPHGIVFSTLHSRHALSHEHVSLRHAIGFSTLHLRHALSHEQVSLPHEIVFSTLHSRHALSHELQQVATLCVFVLPSQVGKRFA